MIGSGKTTFMSRLNNHLRAKSQQPYIINLDPAVLSLPYNINVDIRDTVNYKQVMRQYGLGPNGGIVTSLNLFTTKMDQVLKLIDKRAATTDHILIDTPGQIEVFTWSASGTIITDALAASYPTMLAYIIDTPRSSSPTTFMSNMLYACSILYKTRLPLLLVFNKTDVQSADFAKEWMTDFEAFQAALADAKEESEETGTMGYMGSLMNSMSLVLEEFYAHLDLVPVSAATGDGMDEFLEAVDRKVVEYEEVYLPELMAAIERRKQEVSTLIVTPEQAQTISDVEDEEDDDDEDIDYEDDGGQSIDEEAKFQALKIS